MENINFVIGCNGNIGSEIVNYESKSGNRIIGIDITKTKINNSNFTCWNYDCRFPEKIELALKNLYIKNKFRVKNLVLCAVMDSIPNKNKEEIDLYNYGLKNQNFSEINKRVLINVTSQIYILKIFEPYLFSKSSVCLFSSIYGYASPDQRIYQDEFIKPLEYSASKSSIIGITKHFAVTSALSDKGRCNCIVLGGLKNINQSKEFQKNYINKVPIGRMANINDVINAYGFISSDESSYITGISLFVDGGYSAW
tara:strand:- start:309 stop:1070 length:762 start_codon:yes stop_codon:yes gene_type:complete